jgi:hypothetical protein
MVLHEDYILENSRCEAMLWTTEHIAAQNCNIEEQIKQLTEIVCDLKAYFLLVFSCCHTLFDNDIGPCQ